MRLMYLLLFFCFLLTACSKSDKIGLKQTNLDLTSALDSNSNFHEFLPDVMNAIKNRCITDRFAQGYDESLYGVECIEGKSLLIQTSKEGEKISTSQATNRTEEEGLKLEGDLGFVNHVYQPQYQLIKEGGDDKKIPFLREFLPENKKLYASLDTKYQIVFELRGNYLVLFKAVENLNDLPYTERTSKTMSKNGKLHMVPFLGYLVEYCQPETIRNSQGEDTYEHRANCTNSFDSNRKYIRIRNLNAQNYEYIDKKNLFPANYFEGKWFIATGSIETAGNAGHLSPYEANLVEMKRKGDHLAFIDISGDIESRNRRTVRKLPVQWMEYEMAQNGSTFERFGERLYNGKDPINRPYLQVNFENQDVLSITVSDDYFSYVIEKDSDDTRQKYKVAFLRERAVDKNNFVPKKWFLDDHNKVFGILPTRPQSIKKQAEFSEEERLASFRMIYFNTHLNTEEEKRTKTKIIKWYFSKNSTAKPFYRDIAREAIQIWNRAFEIITENSDEKIKVVLDETKERTLGDLRYNILNMVLAQDFINQGSGLVGFAPSYVNPETGQIIGTTSNVIIHNILESYHYYLRNYIRYEVFQASHSKDDLHVVSPYIRSQIKNQCPEVTSFIKSINKNIKRRMHLNDRGVIFSCGKKISREAILKTLLHEMGHSFGLAHNFKASVDKENYYSSIEEVNHYFPIVNFDHSKEIAKASSVMDYFATNAGPIIRYLGKYDIAVLRYLYKNQVESKDKTFLSLDIPKNPHEQMPLKQSILDQRKVYLYCSDFVLENENIEDPLCKQHDYGSSPSEITQFYIEDFHRDLKSSRYRYDALEHGIPLGGFLHNLSRLSELYSKWLSVRNEYLESKKLLNKSRYSFNQMESVTEYKRILKEGFSEASENSNYRFYYPIREKISKFFINMLFAKTMRCQVEDDSRNTYVLNLESIKDTLLHNYSDNLYVENCYSPAITKFFEENNLKLIEQSGLENFSSYYPKGKHADKLDVTPIFTTIANVFFQRKPPLFKEIEPKFNPNVTMWTDEPDLFEIFVKKAKGDLLNSIFGNHEIDFIKLQMLYAVELPINIQRTLSEPDASDLLAENINHLSAVLFETGTSSRSFYAKVTYPLERNASIENIQIPFLTSAYKDYSKSPGEQSFQDYVSDMSETVYDEKRSILIIPFQNDSFAKKLILKYNETLKEIGRWNKLEKERDLSIIEKIKRDDLIRYNNTLIRLIPALLRNSEPVS